MSIVVFGVVLPWVVLAVGCWIGYLLVRQNGRLLLRLETLEQRLGSLEQQLAPLVALAVRTAQSNAGPAQRAPQGLAVGSEAPNFELPSLSGQRLSLTRS